MKTHFKKIFFCEKVLYFLLQKWGKKYAVQIVDRYSTVCNCSFHVFVDFFFEEWNFTLDERKKRSESAVLLQKGCRMQCAFKRYFSDSVFFPSWVRNCRKKCDIETKRKTKLRRRQKLMTQFFIITKKCLFLVDYYFKNYSLINYN